MTVQNRSSLPPAGATLLIIDVQHGFDELEHWGGRRNNPEAESRIFHLMQIWRDRAWPVLHVQHDSTDLKSPLHPSKPGNALKYTPRADEPLFRKSVNSSFIGTNLEAHLRSHGIENLVICGLTTNHCVSTTTRMAGNFGFNCWLINDCCATFDRCDFEGKLWPAEDIHRVSIANLKDEFATIITWKDLISQISI